MKIERGMIIAESGKFIHRVGDSAYYKSAYILPNDTLANFEEVDTIPEVTENGKTYDERVEELIRERYTIGQELAIQRQRETKPEEFAEYNAFCENCKLKAKEEVL